MIFSVFDHDARCYDYYEAPGTAASYGARGTKYRALTQGVQGPRVSGLGGPSGGITPIGFAPEALALALPSSARLVGRGSEARGVIAVAGRGGSYGSSEASRMSSMWPASPGRFEEEGGTINAFVNGLALGTYDMAGLGADEPTAAPVAPVPVVVEAAPYPFGKVVAAAVIATLVGIGVQRLLK